MTTKTTAIKRLREDFLVSMTIKELDKSTVEQDQVGMVAENVNRVVTALERSYGVKAIPMIDPANDECQLVLQPKGQLIGTVYYYDMQDMVEMDAEQEAARLNEFLVGRLNSEGSGKLLG